VARADHQSTRDATRRDARRARARAVAPACGAHHTSHAARRTAFHVHPSNRPRPPCAHPRSAPLPPRAPGPSGPAHGPRHLRGQERSRRPLRVADPRDARNGRLQARRAPQRTAHERAPLRVCCCCWRAAARPRLLRARAPAPAHLTNPTRSERCARACGRVRVLRAQERRPRRLQRVGGGDAHVGVDLSRQGQRGLPTGRRADARLPHRRGAAAGVQGARGRAGLRVCALVVPSCLLVSLGAWPSLLRVVVRGSSCLSA
jgi:hypothetical protein